jgi:hypothetical protein
MSNQETYHASENMKKFFTKLLELKEFVKKKHEETKDKTLEEIYDKLDQIIKEEK